MSRLTTADRTIRDDEAAGERARRRVTPEELDAQYLPGGIHWTGDAMTNRLLADLRKPDHFDVINALEDRGSAMEGDRFE